MSQSGDGIYNVRSAGGLEFSTSAVEVMQINTCLYLSKGLAEFILIANTHEFFVPQGNNWNFKDVFSSIVPKLNVDWKDEKTMDGWRMKNGTTDDSHGWAQQHAHPYCYISVASNNVYSGNLLDFDDGANPWIGQRYPGHLYPQLIPCHSLIN